MQRVERHLLIEELAKQYEVEAVDLNSPIRKGAYDVLIAAQPSSLAPPQFDRLIDTIKDGVPVLVFEDPMPIGAPYITPTGQPKQPGMSGMFGGGAPTPKGDIRQLWEVLDLTAPGSPGFQGLFQPDLIWQPYNPYPTLEMNVNELWVFVKSDAPNVAPGEVLNDENPITAGMREVLGLYVGGINAKEGSKLKHTPLLKTSAESGKISTQKLQASRGALANDLDNPLPNVPIAMVIEGSKDDDTKDAESESPEKDDAESAESESTDDSESKAMKVVYVADTDIMLPVFSQIRADPDQAVDMRFQFQNVTFILNAIDWLMGETDFIEVRKHEPVFETLTMIDAVKERASTEVRKQVQKFQEDFEAAKREAEEERDAALQSLREDLQKLEKKGVASNAERQALVQRLRNKEENLGRKNAVKLLKYERNRERQTQEIQRKADQEVTAIQNRVKAFAVALPCIPPLIIGVVVFATRRLRERENISKSRLR